MKFIPRFLCWIVLCSVIISAPNKIYAQRRTPTPIPTPLPTVTPTPMATLVPRPSVSAATLQQLRQVDRVLKGPINAVSFELALPSDWTLTGGGTLFLGMTTVFPKSAAITNNAPRTPALLHVGVNGVGLPDIVLDQPDYRQVIIQIPDAALVGKRPNERHVISLQLDDHTQCAADQQISVLISARSQLDLLHTETAVVPDLRYLPWPLYQESILTDTATVVVPDQASPAELNAALTTMAGFARMTSGKLGMTLTTASRMTQVQWAEGHIVLVGKPAAFGMLRDVVLPRVTNDSGSGFAGIATDDGVIQLARSPWGRGRVVLLISGQSDEAVSKAARAISAGQVRPGDQPNLAVIAQVQPITRTALPETFTLLDLGYDIQQFENTGLRNGIFTFDVPDNKAAKEGAYIDVSYLHSPLLDYAQSGFVLALNGQNVGAVRFDDNSTSLSVARVSLSKAAIRPGRNELRIAADLHARERCIVGADLWATIRPESVLHVPLQDAQAERLPRRMVLNTFPHLFVQQPNLSEVAFVLPKADVDSWATAGRLAFTLGARTSADVIQLETAFADSVPAPLREQRHLIVVGQPATLPLLSDLSALMPASFAPGTNTVIAPKTTVQYQLPAEGDLGYLEFMVGPWSDKHAILAVLGNTAAGLQAAADALLTPALRAKMNGNFTVISGGQVDSNDIAVQNSALAVVDPSGAGELTSPPNVAAAANTVPAPSWLIPGVVGSVGLLLLLLLTSMVLLRSRKRTERIEIEEEP